MHQKRLEAAQPQLIDRHIESSGVEHIAEQNHQPAMLLPQRKLLNGLFQPRGCAAGGKLIEKCEQFWRGLSPANHWQFGDEAVGIGADAHTIVIRQRQVAERRGELARKLKFFAASQAHAGRNVDEEIDPMLFAPHELPRDKLIVPRAAIPVDVAQLAARRVIDHARRFRSTRHAQPLPPPQKLPSPSALRLAMQTFAARLKLGVE